MKVKFEKFENKTKLDIFKKELQLMNWLEDPEYVVLKIAYEKKIIQNPAISIYDLTKEDKKNLKRLLFLYNVETYGLSI